MNDADKSKKQDASSDEQEPMCSCVLDPFTKLPPYLRPKPSVKKNSLRQVTCPGCGKEYLTNRSAARCFDCEIR